MNTLHILWDPSPVLFSLGPVDVRWYSLCWIVGIVAVYHLVHHIYREQKIAEEKFEPMLIYCFLGILIGARLGHCLFYEPEYYLANPMQMILPMRPAADGSWHFTGYEGLASHGGGVGLILALLLYCYKTKMKTMFVLDTVAIVTPLCGAAIRLGNLMNSEILGKPAPDVPWAFIFPREDMLPRHPAQLYEALCYVAIFVLLWALYKRNFRPLGSGVYLGACIFLIYICRILIEFAKENQVDFEQGMALNMGQLLSLPYILCGVYFIYKGIWKRDKR